MTPIQMADPVRDELVAVLRECQKQFAFYAENHRRVRKDDKAATNEEFERMCEAAIARIGEPE